MVIQHPVDIPPSPLPLVLPGYPPLYGVSLRRVSLKLPEPLNNLGLYLYKY